jgi:hypothetical protein
MPVIQPGARLQQLGGNNTPAHLAPLERAFDQRPGRTQALLTLAQRKGGAAYDFSGYTLKPDNASTSFDHLLQRKPGLRVFLDLNKDAIFSPQRLQPGHQIMPVAWEGWGHSTVPDDVRKEEISIVVARTGDASSPRVKVPLQNGKTVELPPGYQIVYVGREGDHPRMKEKGGGSQYLQMFDVAGKPGDKLQLAYMRVDPDAQGRMHPHHSGWPDARLGGNDPSWPQELTGYYPGGRNELVTIQAGPEPALIRAPD